MITWDHLVDCIKKLETLPNGGGSEIEFTYNEIDYYIVSHPDCVDLSVVPKRFYDGKDITYSNEKVHSFRSLEELGKADIYGFVLEDVWNSLNEYDYTIKPDFDGDDFDSIYDAYKKANEKNSRQSSRRKNR